LLPCSHSLQSARQTEKEREKESRNRTTVTAGKKEKDEGRATYADGDKRTEGRGGRSSTNEQTCTHRTKKLHSGIQERHTERQTGKHTQPDKRRGGGRKKKAHALILTSINSSSKTTGKGKRRKQKHMQA